MVWVVFCGVGGVLWYGWCFVVWVVFCGVGGVLFCGVWVGFCMKYFSVKYLIYEQRLLI